MEESILTICWTPTESWNKVSDSVWTGGVNDKSSNLLFVKAIPLFDEILKLGTVKFIGGRLIAYSPVFGSVVTVVSMHPPPCWEVNLIVAWPILFLPLPKSLGRDSCIPPPATLPTTLNKLLSINDPKTSFCWKLKFPEAGKRPTENVWFCALAVIIWGPIGTCIEYLPSASVCTGIPFWITTSPSTRIKISFTKQVEFANFTDPVTLNDELSVKLTLLKFGVDPPINSVVVAGVNVCVPNAGVIIKLSPLPKNGIKGMK